MKKLILFWLSCCLSMIAYSQRTEVSYQYYDTFATHDSTKFDWEESQYIDKQTKIFDSNNRLVETYYRIIDKFGFEKEISFSKLKYDGKGRLIEQRLRTSYSRPLWGYKNEHIVQWEYTDFDSLAVYRESEVNDSLKREVIYSEDRRKYDTKNRLTERQFLSHTNFNLSQLELLSFTKYRYNDNNNLLAETDNGSSINTYFYNGKNQLILVEVLRKSEPNNNGKVDFIYNLQEQLVEKISYRGNKQLNEWKITQRNKYGYDSKGNVNSTTQSFVEFDSVEYPYYIFTNEFDDNKRVIKSVNFYYDRVKKLFIEGPKYEYFFTNTGLNEKIIYNNNREFDKEASVSSIKYDEKNRIKQSLYEIVSDYNQKPLFTKHRYRYVYEDFDQPPLDELESYVIYPNPTSDIINIENTLSDNCLYEVTLNDMEGSLIASFLPSDVKSYKAPLLLCSWQLKIPIGLQNGQYLVIMKNGNGKSVGKRVFVNR